MPKALFPAQFLYRPLREAAVEELIVGERGLQVTDLLEELYGVIIRCLRDVSVDAPQTRVSHVVGPTQHLRAFLRQDLLGYLDGSRLIGGDPSIGFNNG